jgi:prevent-host-death family protein
MTEVGMHEAKTKLSQLVERVAAGEDVVITRRGVPAARLVPVTRTSSMASIRGIWKDRVRIADDFDELPDELADAFGTR